MGRQSIIIIVALLLSSCYDSLNSSSASSEEQETWGLWEANTTIEQLHTIYSSGVREINQEIIVEGTVTANDEYGNFFKSFIIENNGYAIEILDGLYDSYVRYPIGSRICLRLNGLGLDRYLGILRTGLVAPATSSYSLDYMEAEAIVNLYVKLTDIEQRLEPRITTIKEVEECNAGEFVSIKSLRLHTDDGVECSWEGYRLFRNTDLDTIWCYTSSYAEFASSKISQESVTLNGILQYGSTDYFSNQFIIKLHAESDCTY